MEIKTIDECFYSIRNGANIKQGVIDGGYPITRIETIANDRFNRDRVGYAGITELPKYESYVLQDGDLLMSHINSVQYLGRTIEYKKIGDETIIHGMNLLLLKANRSIILPTYAQFFFKSPYFKGQLANITKKSVNQASFNVKDLKRIKVSLPTVDEQSKVVDKLLKIRSIIEQRQQELDKLDELVKARFVEMFGDPKYNKSNLVKIGEIGALTSGGTPSRAKPEYFEGNIRWYSAGELNSLYLPDSVEHISEMALQQSSAKLFNMGTLMIGMYDTAAFKMGILTEDSSSNQACANLNPKQGYNIVWLYYLFDIMKPIFLQERQGVRQKNLSLSKIKEFEVPFAPFELQEQFATFVEQTDKSKLIIKYI